MQEAGALLGRPPGVAVLHWHTPANRSVVSLPDDSSFWDIIWKNRANVWGFAHSHPCDGEPVPSSIDITTFLAIETGLGKRLYWYIVTKDKVAMFVWMQGNYEKFTPIEEPVWVQQLRELSNY